jgi:hypothetical protein
MKKQGILSLCHAVNLAKAIPFVLFFSAFTAQSQVCQTPTARAVVIFEPARWVIGDHSFGPRHVATDQDYQYSAARHHAQDIKPNPSPTQCNLQHLIQEMQSTDIGILFICSFGCESGSPCIAIEFYTDEDARDNVLNTYRAQHGEAYFDDRYVVTSEGDTLYAIVLTYDGVDYFCNNLNGALVFADACRASLLNPAWGALTALGWNCVVYNLSGPPTSFFERMCGQHDRGAGNYCREAHDAAALTTSSCYPPGTAHLVCEGANVVLSPIVLEHYPGYYFESWPIYFGSIVFDCVMDEHEPASDLIQITGPQGIQIQDVYWQNNHELRYEFEPIFPECWIDFAVNPEFAKSLGNESQLDGNTNPPNPPNPLIRNGVGPNRDFFNWTCSEHQYSLIDFECGFHNEPIGTSIPGLDFNVPSSPGNYIWVYKEPTPNSVVYPYQHHSNYPVYWFDGRVAAWIGEEAPNPLNINAKIYFDHATASAVCMGYTSYYYLTISAYNQQGEPIGTASASPHFIHDPPLPGEYSLGQVTVTPDQFHLGQFIHYINIYGRQNTWAIDNLIVYDFLRECLRLLPPPYNPIIQKIDEVDPGEQPNSHIMETTDRDDSIRVICYWDSEKQPGIQLTLIDPNGGIAFQKESQDAPILSPVISDPIAGNWKIQIGSLKEEGKAYPYGIVGAVTCEPMVDCYLEAGDIWFDPEEPKAGEKVWIGARIHCGDQFSKPVDQVLVRSYLGDPSGGNQIARDAYALQMEPGSSDTVYFYFDTAECEDISPCEIYIALDPEGELEEYDENNNVAYKKLIFAP